MIGQNGAGKTTLINQLHGTILPDGGKIMLHGIDITRYPTYRRAACGLAAVPNLIGNPRVHRVAECGAGRPGTKWT
ncbi:ATP-binding cassette domain-containing protein [Cupriavidus basilensis]